jgi:hypothetical protein
MCVAFLYISKKDGKIVPGVFDLTIVLVCLPSLPFFFWVGLGFELSAVLLELHLQSIFALGVLEMEYCKLFI